MKKFLRVLFVILVWSAFMSGGYTSAVRAGQGTHPIYLPFAFKPGRAGAPVINSFRANPSQVQPGQASVLSWQVSGATSLTLSPGPGAVTGSGYTVNPATTTDYTLTASNAAGSVQASVRVTVQAASNPAGFFIPGIEDIDRPTSHPTAMVDPEGGMHLSFTPDSNTPEDPGRAAYYAYCAANCTSAEAFTITRLGQDVLFANLALDPAGHPRMLLTVTPAGAPPYYQYATCDSACTQAANWSFTFLTGFSPPSVAWGIQFGRNFALDSQGRPRFVYQDWGDGTPEAHTGNFFAFCNTSCGNPANWYEVLLSTDLFARVFELELSPSGQPRLVWTSWDSENMETFLFYWECNAGCQTPENWSGFRLLTTVTASVTEDASYALETTRDGRPRLAYYTGTGVGGDFPANYLYYLSCDAADCGQPQGWHILNLGLPFTHGEAGLDLALDSQDRPRLAYHAPVAAGFGLFFAWCNNNCESSNAGWQEQELEPSEQVNQELPIPPKGGCSFPLCNPPVPACTISTWNTGVRPSLALDAAGNPRIAYDADHEQGGACSPFTDTRLTRYIQIQWP